MSPQDLQDAPPTPTPEAGPPDRAAVLAALGRLTVPGPGTALMESDYVHALRVEGNTISLVLERPEGAPPADLTALRDLVRATLSALPGAPTVAVAVSTGPVPDLGGARAHGPRPVEGVRHILLVGSGKGGVGKSTLSANLALALAERGLKTGLLDADIYGPSLPHMMGAAAGRPVAIGERIIPIAAHGIKTMSAGYLMAQGRALVWRGPVLVDALEQMLHRVAWGPLDVLVVDLPPGTGDVQITLTQQTRVSGAVIVTTPQDVALLDVRRAIDMLDQTGTPVFGVIENMSTHICQSCGAIDPVFGEGGGRAEAEAHGLPFLGALPLSRALRLAADAGTPYIRAHPESPEAGEMRKIADLIVTCLETVEEEATGGEG